jgi:hypothetical protein
MFEFTGMVSCCPTGLSSYWLVCLHRDSTWHPVTGHLNWPTNWHRVNGPLDPTETAVMAGDFNCRIDLHNHRGRMLITIMEKEGFILVNKPSDKTYFAPNGSSTVVLVFDRGSQIKIRHYLSESLATLRKHCPVITRITITAERQPENRHIIKPARTLDRKLMESVADRMPIIAQHLEDDNLDAAANMVENIIREATNPQINRRAKAWFDAQCYRTQQQTLQALRQARRTNNPEDVQSYAAARKTYKNLLSLKKAEHKEAEARKTIEAALKDPPLACKTTESPQHAHNRN